MKKSIKIIAALLCVAMAFTACSAPAATSSPTASASAQSTAEASPSASASASAETDPNAVIANVNGKEITYETYYNFLAQQCNQYYVTPESLDTSVGVEYANQFREAVVDQLVSEELVSQEAAATGFDKLTAEQEKQMADELEKVIENIKSQLKTNLESAHEDEKDYDIDAALEDEYQAYLKIYGYTEDTLVDMYRKNFIYNLYYQSIIESIKVSDAEIKTYYDEKLAEQQQTEKDDPASACMYYEQGYNEVQLIVPKGMRMVKNLLVKVSDETTTAMEATEDEDEKQKLLDAELKKLKPNADAIYKELQAGGDFDKIMEEKGEDPGMQQDPAKTEGYTVYEGCSMDETFTAQSLALKKIGDYSKPFSTSFGYHIVQYVSDIEPKVTTFDEAKEDISAALTSTKQQEAWTAKLEELNKAAKIERFSDIYLTPVDESAASAEATATPEPEDINDPKATPDVD